MLLQHNLGKVMYAQVHSSSLSPYPILHNFQIHWHFRLALHIMVSRTTWKCQSKSNNYAHKDWYDLEKLLNST